jgi:hypothetical protein
MLIMQKPLSKLQEKLLLMQQQLSLGRKEVNTRKARVELGRMRKTRLQRRSESQHKEDFNNLKELEEFKTIELLF